MSKSSFDLALAREQFDVLSSQDAATAGNSPGLPLALGTALLDELQPAKQIVDRN
jgi:hypothetical protein